MLQVIVFMRGRRYHISPNEGFREVLNEWHKNCASTREKLEKLDQTKYKSFIPLSSDRFC